MEDKKNIIETFTELAPRYEEVVDSELSRFWGWSYAAFVSRLIEMTPVQGRKSILDLATGTGVIPRKILSEQLNDGPIHGLDITMSMLQRGKRKAVDGDQQGAILPVCASAMQIPYAGESFDLVTCALATHHMDVEQLLSETYRILQNGGVVSVADVGGSTLWKMPVVKFLLKVAAFVYFLLKENLSRAWAEADAVSNVRSPEEWFAALSRAGFQEINITQLRSKHRWIPEPLVIQAIKRN
jgi:ubiquinone/menaquinone biosynthesis C-methylase UbiE